MEFVARRLFGGGAVTARIIFGRCGFSGSGCSGFWRARAAVLRVLQFLEDQGCIWWHQRVWPMPFSAVLARADSEEAVFKGVVPSVIFAKPPPLISMVLAGSGSIIFEGGSSSIGFVP